MSYILEALKKLEQKRQQEDTPNLLTLQSRITHVPRKRKVWPYVVGGIILLNITALIILRTALWRPVERPHAVKAPPASLSMSPLPAPPPAANRQDQEIVGAKESVRTVNPPASSVTHEPIPKVPPVKPSLALPSLKEALEASRPAKPLQKKGQAVSMQELPDSIRNTLPELKMTVHSYDQPSQSRFAIINNKLVREGQFVSPELKLEQITPQGVILNYNNNRFLLGIN